MLLPVGANGLPPGSIAVTTLALGPVRTVLWSDGVTNQWSSQPILNTFIGVAANPTAVPGSGKVRIHTEAGAATGVYVQADSAASIGYFFEHTTASNTNPQVLRATASDGGLIYKLQILDGASPTIAIIGTESNHSYALYSNNTERQFIAANGNISILRGDGGSFGSGVLVGCGGNASTVPSTDPTGGGCFYWTGGAYTHRGSGGTVTTMAPA